MCLTSICRLCYVATETVEHLFLECQYVVILWIMVDGIFGMQVPRGNGSIVEMFEACCNIACSSKLGLYG